MRRYFYSVLVCDGLILWWYHKDGKDTSRKLLARIFAILRTNVRDHGLFGCTKSIAILGLVAQTDGEDMTT